MESSTAHSTRDHRNNVLHLIVPFRLDCLFLLVLFHIFPQIQHLNNDFNILINLLEFSHPIFVIFL